jgi:DNA polymerase III epsilon subunit-like protein
MNLFFDTETSGLPKRQKAHYSKTENWPRIVHLAWLIADDKGAVLTEVDYIIKVDFEIPKEASRIHGITNAIAAKKGVLIRDVLRAFLIDLKKADQLICHNVGFDLPVLQSELFRHDLEHEIDIPSFCTMENSTHYCQIPGNRGYKWPRLEELYRVCFGKQFKNAHNAKADVRATYEIFYHLKKEEVFVL